METAKVKNLRTLYGIFDSRNEYTETEILEAKDKKCFYIAYRVDENGEVIFIQKEIKAFISKDKRVWVKDKEITGDNCYIPMLTLNFGKEIEPNVFTRLDGECKTVYYCFTKDKEKYINIAKNEIKDAILERIQYHQEIINKLKEKQKNIDEIL